MDSTHRNLKLASQFNNKMQFFLIKQSAFSGLMVPQQLPTINRQLQYHCHNNPGSAQRAACRCNSTSAIELHELHERQYAENPSHLTLENTATTATSLSYLDKKFDIRVSVLTVSGHDALFWLSPWFLSRFFFFIYKLKSFSLILGRSTSSREKKGEENKRFSFSLAT